MKRTAILVTKQLTPGEVANSSAILLGHLATRNPELYHSQTTTDAADVPHAAIRYSVVVLAVNSPAQIVNLIPKLTASQVDFAVFTRTGQNLNNAFDQYARQLRSMTTAESEPIAVALFGADEEVRALTKKFSLLK